MADKRTYDDPLPFKGRPPDEVRHVGISPSAAEELGVTTGDRDERSAMEGRSGTYRLVFQSMPVPGLPDEVHIGQVRIRQMDGPLWTQRTHITQQPGWRPIYEKWMEHRPVGAGYRLTVCTLPVLLASNMSASMTRWRDEVLAAMSLLVSLLDERLAQVELLEDVIAYDLRPGEKTSVFDLRTRLREFTPLNRVRAPELQALQSLSSIDVSSEDPLLAAGRWYLRAAQSGPTPDAVVFLWIALEALSKPRWGTKLSKAHKKLSDVGWAEKAVSRAGLDPSLISPDLGRLAGLRAEIVHGGVESPALLRDGFYELEAVVRLLLRHQLGLIGAGWSLRPNIPSETGLRRHVGRIGHAFRKVVWRDPPPQSDLTGTRASGAQVEEEQRRDERDERGSQSLAEDHSGE